MSSTVFTCSMQSGIESLWHILRTVGVRLASFMNEGLRHQEFQHLRGKWWLTWMPWLTEHIIIISCTLSCLGEQQDYEDNEWHQCCRRIRSYFRGDRKNEEAGKVLDAVCYRDGDRLTWVENICDAKVFVGLFSTIKFVSIWKRNLISFANIDV